MRERGKREDERGKERERDGERGGEREGDRDGERGRERESEHRQQTALYTHLSNSGLCCIAGRAKINILYLFIAIKRHNKHSNYVDLVFISRA